VTASPVIAATQPRRTRIERGAYLGLVGYKVHCDGAFRGFVRTLEGADQVAAYWRATGELPDVDLTNGAVPPAAWPDRGPINA
jgi:hypothetical protein